MRLLLLCLALASSLLLFTNRATLQTSADDAAPAKPTPHFVPGEIIVRFRADAALAKERAPGRVVLRADGREILAQVERFGDVEPLAGLRLARVAPDETMQAVAALNARADVLYAEPNYIRHKDALPNDPRFAELWGLRNTGQSGGTAGADIHAAEAWETTTGSRSVVVGIVDEGIDINHPDLQANIWRNPAETPDNGVDDDGNGFVDDVNGWDFHHNDKTVYDPAPNSSAHDVHGTHVAGTVGAAGNNGVGVTGVNWQVSLMSLKIIDYDQPAPTSVRQTVQAYAYAKLMRDLWTASGGAKGANIRVLNNSYGGDYYSQAEFDAIRALGDSGILFVGSAGNAASDTAGYPNYPASYELPNVIAVAASDRTDKLAYFSNYGARTVDLAAPGHQVLSTTPNGDYSVFSGTSMASPHTVGVAALVCAAHPEITPARLRAALIYSGDELPALATNVRTGRRLNAAAALRNANNADGTVVTQLTNADGFDSAPAWSPDGARLAFVGVYGGYTQIYVVNADGTNRVKLTYNPSNEDEPVWSPDGTRIAFTSLRDINNIEIYLMNADGTRLVNLTHAQGSDGSAACLQGPLAGGTQNLIFTNEYFVRQHYLDFLNREPDAAGYNAWLSVLRNCADVNNVDPASPSAGCDRITVSAAFFGSPEFRIKGFYIFRFYKLAFNRLPTYAEFITDMSVVSGQTAEELYAKKAAYASAFVVRVEFSNTYANMSNAEFVGALLGRYQLTSINGPDPANPDGAGALTLTKDELIARLNGGSLTRMQVFRAIADSNEVAAQEFNKAFVAMQYYGYLRRTPETAGYNAWLNYLNAHPSDFRAMVNGFMNSTKYRLRFGPV